MNETDLLTKGFIRSKDGSWSKPVHQVGSLAPSPVMEPNPVDDSLAADAGEAHYQGRCLVCITCFRVRLLDDDNPCPKHFVDALKEAGCIIDDSPKYCQIKVEQAKVRNAEEERTEIEILPL